jgi:hypothetical protein
MIMLFVIDIFGGNDDFLSSNQNVIGLIRLVFQLGRLQRS